MDYSYFVKRAKIIITVIKIQRITCYLLTALSTFLGVMGLCIVEDKIFEGIVLLASSLFWLYIAQLLTVSINKLSRLVPVIIEELKKIDKDAEDGILVLDEEEIKKRLIKALERSQNEQDRS